ncbi:hypothetical protein [Gemella sp.]
MGPKFYIEDVNDCDSEYSIDYIKFDELGKIDIVRETYGRNYLVERDIQLPIFETEREYIDYLEKEDIIDPHLAEVLYLFEGYKPELIIMDEISLNNALFIGDARGAERATGFKNAFELLMEATLIWEFSAIDALESTLQVIRTLLRDKKHRYQENLIRIK